jgi:hypothetical protein
MSQDNSHQNSDPVHTGPTFAEKLAMTGSSEDFDAWLALGMEKGWAGAAVCHTHDGLPTTEAEEDEAWDEDSDGEYPCIHVVRLYEDLGVRDAVEQNHAPSVWRKPLG